MAYRLIDIQILKYSKVYREIESESLLIKHEKVIQAPAKGKVKYLVAEGERLRLGAPVATLQTSDLNTTTGQAGSALYTPGAGVFCLHIDGYEEILSVDKLDVLQIPKLEKITSEVVNLETTLEQANDEVIDSGQPVYKLVDNLSPVMIKLEVGDMILPEKLLKSEQRLRIRWQDHLLYGTVVDYKRQNSSWEVFLTVKEYPNDLVHYRKIQLSIALQELSGLIVDRKSIVIKEGQPGIYVYKKNKFLWLPVYLEGQLENKVVVSGEGLTLETRYIHNPFWYKVGSLVS